MGFDIRARRAQGPGSGPGRLELHGTARLQSPLAAARHHPVRRPAGTGKTSLARGLASRTAGSLSGSFTYIEVDPHAFASAAHGKTQQAVAHLFGTVLAEELSNGPCVVLLDEDRTPGRPPR